MTAIIETPLWLVEPSERRLREISHVASLRAPPSATYASSILQDASALRRLALEFIRRANAYTSLILRLPPELIFEIFTHVVRLEPTSPKELGWIRLGHVSYAFRSVLLSMPGLWASAIWDVADHARHEVLSRARDMPLSIQLKTGRKLDVSSNKIKFAMDNIDRARRIKIEERQGTKILWSFEPRDLSGRVFPHLEEIDVMLLHHDTSLRDPDWLGPDVYGLEPVQAPRLRSVFLVNVFIPISPNNLTTLALIRTKYYGNGTIAASSDLLPSPEEFLHMLAQCGNVEYLTLQNVTPAIAPLHTSLRSIDAIKLSSLKELTLCSPMSEIIAFWTYLAPLPHEVELCLKPDYTEAAIATGGFVDSRRLSLISLFLEHLACHDPSRVTALAFEADKESFITQCGFFKRAADASQDSWAGLSVYNANCEVGDDYKTFLDIWLHQCVWAEHSTLARFIDYIPEPFFAQIDTLDVLDVNVEDLQRLFARLPNIHTLHFRSPESSPLASLVYKTESSGPSTALERRAYLPKLTHLRLHDMDFGDIQAQFHGNILHYDEVENVLSSRFAAGVPLQSFHVIQSRIYADQAVVDALIARMQEMVVGDVTADMEVL
ncbi:unnamed protein product [Peniophora sp. CBMAI 1063]|nr:unnamed protein product [Peniophora sp. CBMAI 1063]